MLVHLRSLSTTEIGITFINQFSEYIFTCATQLFHSNIDEQLIKQRTGHRSDTSLRLYKRECSKQEKHTSEVLDPPVPRKITKNNHVDLDPDVRNFDFSMQIELGINFY